MLMLLAVLSDVRNDFFNLKFRQLHSIKYRAVHVKSTNTSQLGGALDWTVISSQLAGGAGIIRHHEIHADISSTNDIALQQCAEEEKLPAVYFSERQTAGRGRRGREWFSPHSQNIYMSLSWQMQGKNRALGGLSIAMGVAIARCLRQYGLMVGLKWPNDILLHYRKMAGILVETRMRAGGMAIIVVGVGLNYEMKRDEQTEQHIQQAWTDFSSEYTGDRPVSRSELAGRLLDYLLCGLNEYESVGLGGFLNEWRDLDVCIGQQIDILVDGVIHSGSMLGVEPDGAVRVQLGNEQKTYHSAEISLRLRS